LRKVAARNNSSIGASLQAYKNSGIGDFRGNSLVGDNTQTYENTGGTNISDNRTDSNLTGL